MNYLIFSNKHTHGIAMWWRANAAGYTNNLDAAGRYTKEEAESYCAGSHGEDFPIDEHTAYDMPSRRIIDLGDGANHARLMPPNAEVRGDAPLYGAASLSTDGLCGNGKDSE